MLTGTRPAWHTRAACQDETAELFFEVWPREHFTDRRDRETAAVRVCSACPVRQECLDDALADGIREQAEVRGGFTAEQRRTELAANLSHGQKQWLEIGMLLAQEPKLLLVDEPVAGMTDAETEETARLLKEIAKTRSVVVVEHDMHFVRELGVKVTCLHEGSVLSEGTLDAVSSDERVVEVYLGR